ncbi:MAG: DUF2950 domain-containing protein [Terriglobales bacterium]|jgi:hypothetical protein
MRRTNIICGNFSWANLPGLAVGAVLLTACLSISSTAQEPGQKTFASPEDASSALVAAAEGSDEKAMLEILGPDGKRIVSSGDEAEDTESRANFVKRYQEMHRVVNEPNGTTTLYIGAENWPTPIPLVNKGNVWYFDTLAGKTEILYRRIGQNETSAISVCQQLVAAQKEYHAAQHDAYAQKLFSDDGQHNGLYWKAADGQPPSPIGPLLASAEALAHGQPGAPTPYRGYYYRILTRQKKITASGAKSYVVNGKMSAGFAFVAYPAEYRSSGVMTFIVNEDGVVYEKDLGRKTEVLAKGMKAYDPKSGWQQTEEELEETANAQDTK